MLSSFAGRVFSRRSVIGTARLRLSSSHHRQWLSTVEDNPDSGAALVNDTNDLKKYLRPSEIVKKLDDYVVGQQDAKRAVAIALRNRWRRRMLPEDI